MRIGTLCLGILGFATPLWAAESAGDSSVSAQVSQGLTLDHELVRGIRVRGTGCSARDVDWNTSANGQSFSLQYGNFFAEATGGAHASSRCRADVLLSIPEGYRVAVSGVSTQGSVHLSDATSGAAVVIRAKSRGYRDAVVISDRKVRGFLNQDVTVRDSVGPDAFQWSDCGGRHRIRLTTDMAVESSQDGRAYVGAHQGRGAMVQDVQLVWQPCGEAFEPNPEEEVFPPNPDEEVFPPNPDMMIAATNAGREFRSGWVGSCDVVLETVWGSNREIFVGHARARNFDLAVMRAKRQGLRRCERERNDRPLLRCVVDDVNCTAFEAN